MKFTERVLLLIINELGLEIRSVKANCSHRAGPPATEGPAGHIGSRGEFHEEEGRGGDRFLDFLRSLEMTGKLRCFRRYGSESCFSLQAMIRAEEAMMRPQGLLR